MAKWSFHYKVNCQSLQTIEGGNGRRALRKMSSGLGDRDGLAALASVFSKSLVFNRLVDSAYSSLKHRDRL
jgi:hypothetical protein